MKKKSKVLCTCILCISLTAASLTGCDAKDKASTGSKKAPVTQTDLAASIKTKYASSQTNDYQEPLYNVEKDHVFTYENVCEEFWNLEPSDCFSVYYDSDLTQEAMISVEADYDAKTVTVKPSLTFNFEESQSSLGDDGTWGSRSKFWLVQNVNLQTGQMLEKPMITVFTTKEEMNTPTVTQGIAEDGNYCLSWKPVEDADYYEVYEYLPGSDFASLEATTEGTDCKYSEFETAINREKHFNETYAGTEVDDGKHYIMNSMLDLESGYFVVARKSDGTHSGMSNTCMVSDIAGQIPYTVSDDFTKEYEGDSALCLPAYVDVEMKDGSTGQFLIHYAGSKITLLADQSIFIECSIKNLPIEMPGITFKGMDWDAFREDTQSVKDREEKLATKSATSDAEIDVPYLPDSDVESSDDSEDSNSADTEYTDDSGETESQQDTENSEFSEDIQTEATSPSADLDDASLTDTVVANSALSEWIAVNMLAHKSEIPLKEFPESSDSEYLMDALLEAYNQNPLIGIMDSLKYNYKTNTLLVDYVLSEEETRQMQEDSLNKAKEIATQIIKDSMSDFEKEEAINRYLCENGSYNDQIMDYINSDGTIDPEATHQFANSFTPYGILVENCGVCESYAEAFLLLAREAGLDAVITTGTLDGVNHEWNRINLDGSWYTIDVTNNDNDYVPDIYFNLPDDLASKRLIQNNDCFLDKYVENYSSEGMDYEYYTQNNLYTEDSSTAANLLADSASQNQVASVRIPADTDEQTVQSIAQDAVNKAGITSGKYYFDYGVLSLITAE